ncbi:thiopurine S-methyltransferase [Halomonas sp. 707D4]|uniref:thiopurine S-methyltransferase n=1 Tax=Halomonas sp. 707D4 TaxID=1904455 RepID=UPI00209D25FD|nr:thiopurine S-methyltransferase [Halomonas sp. 707D4]
MHDDRDHDNPWRRRWREGRIGFHQDAAHPALVRYWPTLGVAPGAKVLVPLCGKSLDMRWLSQAGHPVLGVELAPEAVEQFIAQSQDDVSRYHLPGFEITRQGTIELWRGDFFHLHIHQAFELGAFFDRAALIALPPATRQRYAFHLAQLLPPGVEGLLISVTHENGGEGPPYSVRDEEIEALFERNFTVACLEQSSPDARGVAEQVWRLTRRGPR